MNIDELRQRVSRSRDHQRRAFDNVSSNEHSFLQEFLEFLKVWKEIKAELKREAVRQREVKELYSDLGEIMPNSNPEDLKEYATPLHRAMEEYGINTPERQQAFIAQLAHESIEFTTPEEIWGPTPAQEGYEGRADLGNVNPGDGERYKGRGLIQVTGRANYREVGEAIGVDLENNPEMLLDPEISARAAAYFWESRGLNELADQGDFREITRRINGGYNGYDERLAYYESAKSAID